MSDKDMYLGWLADVHSAENTMVAALEDHMKDAGEFPELRRGLERHLEQTRRHAQVIKGCLDRNGGGASALKNTLGTLGGTMKNMVNASSADEVVKNTIDDFIAENMEIASYISLIAAAEQFGDTQTAQVCRNILQEEEEAAALIRNQLRVVTLATLRNRALAGS